MIRKNKEKYIINFHLPPIILILLTSIFKPKRKLLNLDECREYESEKIQHNVLLKNIDVKDKVIVDFGCAYGGETLYYVELGAAFSIGLDRACPNLCIA